ncbi:MAG TPA: hypothetical protein PKA27_04950 [Fimbriimonadaceae bacterium]|nr:hypothetical protein [Fimbriimonadaceae bacterium]
MAIPKSLGSLAGNWTGESVLHLPWLPEGEQILESTSTLNLWVSGREDIAAAHYTWEHEGHIQAGAIVIAASPQTVTAGWSDTWHQKEAVLALSGSNDDILDVTAPYAKDQDGHWQWRIKLYGAEMSLYLEMFNISPNVEETWAVRAQYRRQT